MKEKELREAAKCAVCGRPIGHTGIPMFYRVKVTRHALNIPALSRQSGLERMLRNATLAQVMGPDEEMTEIVSEVEFSLCECCAYDRHVITLLGREDENDDIA